MPYHTEGNVTGYPERVSRDTETARGAVEAHVSIRRLCESAVVFDGAGPVTLQELRERAFKEAPDA